jgi:uncharacterized protein YutE (UPF0331/DUF86 family)
MIDRELVTRKLLLVQQDLDALAPYACAGLRNRIAHEYDEIDPARVHASLETALLDLPEWMRCVLDFVERTAR